MYEQTIAAVMHDQDELAELSKQLRKLQLHGTDQLQHLKLAVEMCAQTLKENAATHSELLVRFTKLQKNYEALKAGQPSGENVVDEKGYVMVLVDAHSHKFKDTLLSDKSKGGPLAARLLREAVEEYLLRYLPGLSKCCIIVQAFANLKQLSVDAAQKGLIDSRLPFLGTFTSGFSARVDCDFIDVQDKSVLSHKILKRLQDCVNDSSCGQVFLAAAGSGLSAELLEDVIKYDGNVTLIRTGQGPQEFALPSASFPKVFQTFEKGRGASTKGLILGEKNLEGADRIDDNILVRKKLGADLVKAEHLPNFSPPGLIPVNSRNERLDIHMRQPTPLEWVVYNAQTKIQKPCGFYHMGQPCNKTPCVFDHTALGPVALYCLQFHLKNLPCGEGSSCRRLDCFYGHICQKDGCCGTSSECSMRRDMHISDLRVSKFVKAGLNSDLVEGGSVPSSEDFIDLI